MANEDKLLATLKREFLFDSSVSIFDDFVKSTNKYFSDTHNTDIDFSVCLTVDDCLRKNLRLSSNDDIYVSMVLRGVALESLRRDGTISEMRNFYTNTELSMNLVKVLIDSEMNQRMVDLSKSSKLGNEYDSIGAVLDGVINSVVSMDEMNFEIVKEDLEGYCLRSRLPVNDSETTYFSHLFVERSNSTMETLSEVAKYARDGTTFKFSLGVDEPKVDEPKVGQIRGL